MVSRWVNVIAAASAILAAYVFGNVHLTLHSTIGKPFDFKRSTGVVGRSYAYQSMGCRGRAVPEGHPFQSVHERGRAGSLARRFQKAVVGEADLANVIACLKQQAGQ